jgi:hypothetical protein
MPKINKLDVDNRWDVTNEDEYLWWPRVHWIDPGAVSGVATIWFDPKALFEEKPLGRVLLAYSEIFLDGPEDGINGQSNRFLRFWKDLSQEPGLATGCESFVPRMLNQDEDFLAPVRIKSMIQFELSRKPDVLRPKPGSTEDDPKYEIGVPLWMQSPSDAKNAFNDTRLRNMGMYRPGPDHVNDAKRHGLLWIRKLRAAGREFFEQAHGNEGGWFE